MNDLKNSPNNKAEIVNKPKSLIELLESLPKNEIIRDNTIKAWHIINNPKYKSVSCAISGGSDSDVMLDICYKCDLVNKITYLWFDTGIEYQATKDHLDYLEQKYSIKIKRCLAWKYGMTIPASTKKYGQPFISKYVSEMMHRLQLHNFDFKNDGNKDFDELYKKYPKCKGTLLWWCNQYKDNSFFNIKRNKYLKEFVISNPPQFNISSMCCQKAKKDVAHKSQKEINADLVIIGIRRAEGGIRAAAYNNCYTENSNESDQYRPLFWYSDKDKECYENHFNIVHSRCYSEYGLKRTGCCGCAFSLTLENELNITKKYEPKLYKAINNIFKDTYEYTREYKKFVNTIKNNSN